MSRVIPVAVGGWLSLAVLFFLAMGEAEAQRSSERGGTYQMIYEAINGSAPCYRKLNGTHQTGCASSMNGDVGVLHLVDDDDSLNWVIQSGPHSPYLALLYPEQYTQSIMDKLKKSERVSGVLVLNNTLKHQKLAQFSPDQSCPNKGYGLFTNPAIPDFCSKWNAPGDGLLFERYDFPVFFIHDEKNSTKLVECYEKYNKPVNGTARDWPLCAAQLKAFMMAAVDTPTCLRRSERFSIEAPDKVCDPLGDLNLWTSVKPSNQSNPYTNKTEGSVIVISARMDTASVFDQVARGADSAVTGLVTSLMVLKHLSKYKMWMESSRIRNVYLMLFHGESFDYIGSSRMVYDMMNNNFPSGISNSGANVSAKLNVSDIKYFIELGQVALTDETEGYWIHEWNKGRSKTLSDILVTEGHYAKLRVDKVTSTEISGFPPSSLQSFLKMRDSIPGVYLANHEKSFRNKFYNSVFDEASRLNYTYQGESVVTKKIAKLATTVANTVLNLVTDEGGPRITDMEINLVDELLNCYLVSANCTLFRKMAGHDQLPPHPFDMYVGVHKHTLPVTKLTMMLMIYFQGDVVPSITKESDCKTPDSKKNVGYQWIDKNCYETAVNSSVAHSPAFIIDNYDWSSGKYSTWTESVWNRFEVRIFLKPSLAHEIITLVSGILVFLASFVAVRWVNLKSDVIFPNRPAGITC